MSTVTVTMTVSMYEKICKLLAQSEKNRERARKWAQKKALEQKQIVANLPPVFILNNPISPEIQNIQNNFLSVNVN